VTLKVGTTEVTTISQNRRDPDGPIETIARVLLAAPAGAGKPVATLVNYACHATVLERDNYLYTADFPGATAAFIERSLGGVGIYMQGAAGDINPVWMRHDFEEADRIGSILGAAAVRTVLELRPLGEGQWAVNLSWSEESPKEPVPGTVLTNPCLRGAQTFLELPRRIPPSREELEQEIAWLEGQLAALPEEDIAGRRSLRPRLNELRVILSRYDWMPAQPGDTRRAEIQALRIADECAVVALPGEFLVEIGHELERRCGIRHLLICGYANDYLSYVPMAKHFPEAGYEVGCALFAPEAAEMIIDAAVRLVRSLYEEA
jgi:neutral ceramidase